jgi:hypothetical protein
MGSSGRRSKQRDPDLSQRQALHAMLVFVGSGLRFCIILTGPEGSLISVQMDMMHVGCSEKLARSWMSSTTTSATVGDCGLSTARSSYSSLDSSCTPEAVGTAVSCEHRSRFGQHVRR